MAQKHNLTDLNPCFEHELEAQRERWFRRRFFWYLAIKSVMCLVGLGRAVSLLWGGYLPVAWGLAPAIARLILQASLYGGAILYLRYGRSRQGTLISWAMWLIVVDGTLALAYATFQTPKGSSVMYVEYGVWADIVFSVAMTHILACLLLPWSWRETLKIAGMLMLLYTIAFVTITRQIALWEVVHTLEIAVLLAAPGMLVCRWRFPRLRRRLNSEMLAHRYQLVDRDLTDARKIHEAILPERILAGPLCFDYVYEPVSHLGGDFVFLTREQDLDAVITSIGLVVIDVTGHGIGSAVAVHRLIAELDRLFGAHAVLAPGQLLVQLNRFVYENLARHQVFVTAFCLRADAQCDNIEWANGGHPPPFLCKNDGGMTQLDSTAPMLGLMPPEEYAADQINSAFHRGDRLLVYTDGATDASDDKDAMLRVEGLGALVGRLHKTQGNGKRHERMAQHLMHEIAQYRAGPSLDDTLIIEVWRPA